MAQVLVIWNPVETNPPNIGTPSDEEDVEWVSSLEQFNNLTNVGRFFKCLLLAELIWEGRSATHFYGFKVLEKLRIHHQALFPVYVCSLHPYKYFMQKGGVYQIFRTPGHFFVHLPCNAFAYKPEDDVRPLTLNLLRDISHHFFQLDGWLDEIFHSLKGAVNYDAAVEVQKHFEEIAKIILPEQHRDLFFLRDSLIADIAEASNKMASAKLVSDYKMRVTRLLPQSEPPLFEETLSVPWRVLCVDDDQKVLNNLQSAFLQKGINIFTARSGEEAFSILEQDLLGQLKDAHTGAKLPQNSITLIVCDLRFIDKNGNWHYWQGWDIIEHIFYRMTNMLAFFVLTTKKGAIVRQLQKEQKVRMFMFSKEDVLSGDTTATGISLLDQSGFNIFSQRVREEAEKMHETLCTAPSGEYWAKKIWKTKINYSLQKYYRFHRLSVDYEDKETWINECALQFVEQAKFVKDPQLKSIKSIKDTGFDCDFMAGLTKSPEEPGAMNKFYTKLIGRRIAFGLYKEGWKPDEISSILKIKNLDDPVTDRQLFSAYFAMSSSIQSDIPRHLLVEEKNWLTKDLGYSLHSSDDILFSEIKEKIDILKGKLQKANCPDNYLDERISIANKAQAKEVLEKARKYAGDWKLGREFYKLLEPIWQNKRLETALKRNELLGFLNEFSR